MDEENITRCPGCETSFKVTAEQLAAAEGAVRCGACLQVFVAMDYMVEVEPTAETSDEPVLQSIYDSDSERPDDTQDEYPGVSIDDQASETKGADLDETNPAQDHVYESADQDTNPAPEVQLHEPAITDDADETDVDSAQIEPQDQAQSYWQAELNAAAEADDDERDAAETDWSGFDDSTDDNHSAQTVEASQSGDDSELNDELNDELDAQLDQASDAMAPEQVSEQSITVESASEESQQEESDPLSGFVGELKIEEAEPVEIVGEIESGASRSILWFSLTILMLVCLGLQYGWYNRDKLSQQTELRPYYEKVCSLIDCKLPERTDMSALSAIGLVVRSHPEKANALVVDAVVRNTARFRQRFPRLELNFADINGVTIAQRRFTAKDYLGGELSGMKYVPAETEFRLSLEIVDPGKAAVSYSMRVLPN